jgi:DNA repair exonuclease SbcCD nuclease subunit
VTREAFTFLHTGDLHLDTPFTGLSTAAAPHVAERLRVATLTVWDRIVALALERKVDFVVVAGDVFESETRSLLAQLRFADGLRELSDAGVPSFVVTGNHDPLSGWEATVDWPVLAHRFGPELDSRPVMRDGREIARVFGISYAAKAERRDLASTFARIPDTSFAVGLLHGTIGEHERHERYAPTTEDVLARSGMDYWALGHIHRRRIVRDANPCIVYPGNPQGRDPGEPEPRGVAIVTVPVDGNATVEFIDTDVVRWRILAMDLSRVRSIDAVRAKVVDELSAEAKAAGRSLVARLVFTGVAPLHDELRRAPVAKDLIQVIRDALAPVEDPFVWVESIRVDTQSEDQTTYARGGDFVGELQSVVAASIAKARGEPTAAAQQVVDAAAIRNELLEHDRIRHFVSELPLDMADEDAIRAAQALVDDRLRGIA